MSESQAQPDNGRSARERELILAARADAARVRPFLSAVSNDLLPPKSLVQGNASASVPGPPLDAFTGYQILAEIHRGGQGIVYEAVQNSTRRKVAIKVMKEGPFASLVEKARFDREVQILGQLKHPSIVAVHGTGVAAGHFYFVMDYVHGRPLEQYVAATRCTVAEILDLFARIAEAVSDAHLRGIIHRDLKPNNVRVDDSGVPHILDFGLAKTPVADPDMAGVTATGQFVGSLPWASPEQAAGIPVLIDIRTDVYSLGVMLFQTLTGRFPYEIAGSLRDVLDRIMNADPIPMIPLRPELNDEVTTIVLKCLEKQRDRRYQSARELARDLRHYQLGEPIEAKRDSSLYVLRKQLRRHRVALVVAMLFLVTIIVGMLTSAIGWRYAVTQRDKAIEARSQAEAVTGFLTDMLSAPNPNAGGNSGTTVREFADRAARGIESAFPDKPAVRAALHQTLAGTYDALGLFQPAQWHFETAIDLLRRGPTSSSPELAACLQSLAQLNGTNIDAEEADQLSREALAINQETFGARHPEVAGSLVVLGRLLYRLGRYGEAELILRDAVAQYREFLGESARETTITTRLLGVVLREKGDYVGAQKILQTVLAIQSETLGEKYPDIALTMAELGETFLLLGYYHEAEDLQQRALMIRRDVFGDEHHTIANSLSNLAQVSVERNDFVTAESLYRQSLEMRRRVYGPQQLEVTFALNGLGRLYLKLGRYIEAEALLRESLDIFDATAPMHWRRAYAACMLAASLTKQQRLAEAQPYFVTGIYGVQSAKGACDVVMCEVTQFAEEFCSILPVRSDFCLSMAETFLD